MASLVRSVGFFHLPECKVRSYEELHIMNGKILKAWEFSEYEIDYQVHIKMKLRSLENRE